jgi:hypothetical protein
MRLDRRWQNDLYFCAVLCSHDRRLMVFARHRKQKRLKKG